MRGLLWLILAVAAIAQDPQRRAPEAYERGVRLAGAGKPVEALAALEEAARTHPASPNVHNLIGAVLAQMGRLEEAHRAYERALALAPAFLPARKNKAINAFALKRYQEAARDFQELAREAPDDFVPPLFLGLLALEDSKPEAARRHLESARRRAPQNFRVLLALAKADFLLGNRGAALETANALRGRSELSDGERMELGVLLGAIGANIEAAEVFRTLPQSYEMGFNLALVEYRAGRHQQALQAADALLASGQRTGELLNLRGWILAKLRRPEEARASLEQALALEPGNADHYLDLSTLRMNEGKPEEALRLLRESMRGIPGDARLPVAAGLVSQSAGELPQAELFYRQALQVEPASSPAHLALANLLYETGRTGEAFEQLDRGLALRPSDALLAFAYGALLLDSAGEPDARTLDRAKSMLLRAGELSPYYANTWYLLGRLSQRLDDDESAWKYFEKACALEPEHARSLYQLSQIARRRGDNQKAAELAAKVRMLREEAVREDRKLFATLAEESLRGGKDTNQVLRPPK